jgi:hypothetical protein
MSSLISIHERKFRVTYPWIYLFFLRINHVIIIQVFILRIADNVTKRVVRTKLNIFDLLNVNAVCKITESHYMKHNLCVENFDFYHMIYEYLDGNHVIYARSPPYKPDSDILIG